MAVPRIEFIADLDYSFISHCQCGRIHGITISSHSDPIECPSCHKVWEMDVTPVPLRPVGEEKAKPPIDVKAIYQLLRLASVYKFKGLISHSGGGAWYTYTWGELKVTCSEARITIHVMGSNADPRPPDTPPMSDGVIVYGDDPVHSYGGWVDDGPWKQAFDDLLQDLTDRVQTHEDDRKRKEAAATERNLAWARTQFPPVEAHSG